MNTLLATVGLPLSGKSTWAIKESRAEGFPVVSIDSIRSALRVKRFPCIQYPMVLSAAKVMIKSLFLAGHETVILDTENTRKKHRDEWKDSLWLTLFVKIDESMDVCIARAKQREDANIVTIIENMASRFEDLDDTEQGSRIVMGVS